MLMMLGLWRLARQANAADAHDAGALAPAPSDARAFGALMLMMLGLWRLPRQANTADVDRAGAKTPASSASAALA